MRTIVMLILCMFCLSQIACAEESVEVKEQTEQEIRDMVKEIVETPREYDMPADVLARLKNVQNAMNRADNLVKQRENELELASKNLAIMKLEKQRLTELLSAEFRLFLTSKGVPYNDLPKWQLQNNRAIRTENSK